MGNAPFVPRGKQGRALCFRLKQANTSKLSKKPQNRLEQKTSGRYKLVVQEGQAPRMGIIGNTLIESPRTPFSANTLLWTPFGATQTTKEDTIRCLFLLPRFCFSYPVKCDMINQNRI